MGVESKAQPQQHRTGHIRLHEARRMREAVEDSPCTRHLVPSCVIAHAGAVSRADGHHCCGSGAAPTAHGIPTPSSLSLPPILSRCIAAYELGACPVRGLQNVCLHNDWEEMSFRNRHTAGGRTTHIVAAYKHKAVAGRGARRRRTAMQVRLGQSAAEKEPLVCGGRGKSCR